MISSAVSLMMKAGLIKSDLYWKIRYELALNSGEGSYGKPAMLKAEFINNFISANRITTVMEFGCGDGNQLTLAHYPSYIGYDISQHAIMRCKEIFKNDNSKVFKTAVEYNGEQAECVLSLDVLYHLIEADTWTNYIRTIFNAAQKYVIIYSTDTDRQRLLQVGHVKHRNFSRFIAAEFSRWVLLQHATPSVSENTTRNRFTCSFFVFGCRN